MRGSRSVIVSAVFGAVLVSALASADAQEGQLFPLRAWDRQFADARVRYAELRGWHKEAVLDRETGLVWQRSPIDLALTWTAALAACRTTAIGGRYGWRAPQEEELASVGEAAKGAGTPPIIPDGAPFIGVSGVAFWTATTEEAVTSDAYVIVFGTTSTESAGVIAAEGKTAQHGIWCVRGAIGAQNPQ